MEANEADNQPHHVKALAEFLIRHHSHHLRSIVLSTDPKLHYPLYIDFAELMDENPQISHLLFWKPTQYLRLFDQAALWAHKIVLKNLKDGEKGIEKKFIHVRINISGSPLECPESFPSIGRIRVKHLRTLLTLKGTVIRSGAMKGRGCIAVRNASMSWFSFLKLLNL